MTRSAVVIGAGLAGMLAAAALSPMVGEVTVLERDPLPSGPEPRKGLPQSRHAHLLLPGGRDAIESLVPGVSVRQKLLDSGAREVSITSGMLTLGSEGWFRRWRHDSDHVITCSRDLLDWTVREAVLSNTHVKLRSAKALALLGTTQRVTGLRVSELNGPEEDLTADLVVDASGRGSRTVRWLAQLGITDIPEAVVDSGLVYASRLYRIPDGAEKFPLTAVQANPFAAGPGRSATLVPIEGGRWIVSLSGTRGGEPNADSEDFIRFALGLRHPIVGELISSAKPLSDVVLSRSTRNGRRYFEKARNWPDGLVALGDAIATYNPVYGQGMSVAALGAQALSRELRQSSITRPGLACRIQRAAARPVDAAWALSTSQDQWFPEVRGKKPTVADRLITSYTRRMTRVSTSSYRVTAAMARVTTLQESATRLIHPSLLIATLSGPPLPALAGPPLTEGERRILHALDPSPV
ncbi:pyridine nucleotide-disulfide oxidoreductase [Streptomyces sp. NBC_01764]|uniref:FAD-dependent oxidoreductase n=1 Tax=Streptomyces sp. NBC_01764 TaxID=2975935 RepID=UPI00225BC4A2|nr:pyridine nucleotide-disulfide oxidoreductase [Streptomyces sp. NBC_01764]MCX4411213.1 pyridine nucleotide-disulfide oxidoreductase [Streptomyces sp. NBC_01764]